MPETQVSILFDAQQVRERVVELAHEIATVAAPRICVVGLLKGCFIFVADLMRALRERGVSTSIDFLTVSSYGNERTSSGSLKVTGPVPSGLAGKPVLLVDDIADTGRSLSFAKRLFEAQGSERVMSCVLVDKPSRREVPFQPDFSGFTVGDQFVVGYGIDYAERYRQLPYLGAVR
jgi:hypoxanthine phosphoribosyltransferase